MRAHTIIVLTAFTASSTTLAGPCDPATLLQGGDPTLLGSGADPRCVITEDLNSDGSLDLIIARWGDDTMSVHMGIGDGSFAPQVEYSLAEGIGMRPVGLGVADFDNDGHLDIAVGNTGDSTVTIMLGDGTGAFSSNGAFDAGFFVMPVDLVIGDLDHDGDQDIVVASEVNQVRVMLNNGDATFAAPVFNPIISSVNSVAIADINNDNNDDIIATGFTTNEVFVLYGVGNGTLGPPNSFPTSNTPADVEVADIDNDGDLDLVTCTFFDVVAVHLNDGFGNFNTRNDYPCGIVPRDVELHDMDGDGDLDVIVATQSSIPGTVSVLLNDGTGALSAQFDFPGTNSGRGVAIGDFNGDGGPDVAAVFEVTNDLIVYLNQCPPTSCGCNPADLADPCGVLNFFDVSAFLVAYNAQDPAADFNADGMVNFFDVSAFLTAFNNGCP